MLSYDVGESGRIQLFNGPPIGAETDQARSKLMHAIMSHLSHDVLLLLAAGIAIVVIRTNICSDKY